MNWDAVTAVSTAFTGVVIALTAAVGMAQLRQLGIQRRDAAAIEMVRSLQDVELTRSWGIVLAMPACESYDELRNRGDDYNSAARFLAVRFVMLGLLVHRNVVSFDIAKDLTGGICLAAWARLRAAVPEMRRQLGNPALFEWFQWLAERFENAGKLKQPPAHERYADWTSP
ncbi:MAG: hypothetical protein JO349_00380 [Candidatus Eremiobacteraeota bacterium]|nr:hypothetical protein [Candidatus Eremiobacteraeota bacterium]